MNNYQFYNYDWYSNRGQNNYFVPTRNSQDNLFDPKDGFEKGNMFMSLYNQYKNYQPANLNPKNEQEKDKIIYFKKKKKKKKAICL